MNTLLALRKSFYLLCVTVLVPFLLSGCVSKSSPLDAHQYWAMDTTEQAILDAKGMLEEYYKGSDVLRQSWLRDTPEANSFLADKFARAIVWQDEFVIAAMGSSVTVGDGNCRYDNYTSQLERLMGPILSLSKVSLEIRNSALGGECGDSHKNQIWCIESLAGEKLDILHYSWTYFEAGDKDKEKTHEMFYRWALMQSGAPVPQLLYASDCKTVSKIDENLLDSYEKYGANFLCMTRGIKSAGYKGKVWGEIGDTLHGTTRYGEDASLSVKRRESLGVVFRNWHPGPLLFQTTADAFAYAYFNAMLLALEDIRQEPYPKKRWPKERSQVKRANLPAVKICDPEICGLTSKPSCLTFSKPTFGTSQITWLQQESSGWQLNADPVKVRYPEQNQSLDICQYSQHCGGLTQRAGHSGELLKFELPKLERGLIAVCCSGKKCGHKLKEAGLDFRLNEFPIDQPLAVMDADKCLVVSEKLTNTEAKKEHNSFSIQIPAGVSIPPITHILSL